MCIVWLESEEKVTLTKEGFDNMISRWITNALINIVCCYMKKKIVNKKQYNVITIIARQNFCLSGNKVHQNRDVLNVYKYLH